MIHQIIEPGHGTFRIYAHLNKGRVVRRTAELYHNGWVAECDMGWEDDPLKIRIRLEVKIRTREREEREKRNG
jgi:hypothetical protein